MTMLILPQTVIDDYEALIDAWQYHEHKHKVWVTAVGEHILIGDMTEAHIKNTINHLISRRDQMELFNYAAVGCPDGIRVTFMDTSEINEWLCIFNDELKYRAWEKRRKKRRYGFK